MEQGDDGALELGAAAGVDGGWGEALPDDRLADCLNEEGDAGALLEQLVLEEDNEVGHEQMDDGHEAHAGPDVTRLSVHASHHIDSVCAPLIKALCLGMSPTSIRPVFGRERLIENIIFLKGNCWEEDDTFGRKMAFLGGNLLVLVGNFESNRKT